MIMKTSIELVTNQIKDLLGKVSTGEIEYWIPLSGKARNPYSEHTYTDMNQLLLTSKMYFSGFEHNLWMTFSQIKKSGASVKKGAKASIVTFSDKLYELESGERVLEQKAWEIFNERKSKNSTIKNLADAGITFKRFVKNYYVFNVEQTNNLDESFMNAELVGLTKNERIHVADMHISDSNAHIQHVAGNSAHYDPVFDKIQMPHQEQFGTIEQYYRVLFHELIHWTSHKDRLNRSFPKLPQKKAYAFEELIAELGSAFMAADLGMDTNVRSSAAYIDTWMKELDADKMYFFKAVRFAHKAVEYLMC